MCGKVQNFLSHLSQNVSSYFEIVYTKDGVLTVSNFCIQQLSYNSIETHGTKGIQYKKYKKKTFIINYINFG